jgi:hypothetical protein
MHVTEPGKKAFQKYGKNMKEVISKIPIQAEPRQTCKLFYKKTSEIQIVRKRLDPCMNFLISEIGLFKASKKSIINILMGFKFVIEINEYVDIACSFLNFDL